MTIRFVTAYKGYHADQIVSGIGSTEEARLIGLRFAVADLDGPGNSPVPVFASTNLTGGVGNIKAGELTISPPSVNARHVLVQNDFDIFDCYPVSNRRAIAIPSPTSDIAPDVVHPSVVHVPAGLFGWRYWMAYTPYPLANSDHENPCIVVSQDGEAWEVPGGGVNPIIGKPSGGYNADTELVLSPDLTTLYLIYRERVAATGNRVMVQESKNGTDWTQPVAIKVGTYGAQDYASPSVFFDYTAQNWVMISHNLDGGATYPMQICRTSGSSIYAGWGAPSAITITNPTGGRTWWHSQFKQLPDGRICGLVQDVLNGGSGSPGALFVAESLDGGVNFAVKPIYADTYHYRPAFNFAKSDDGGVSLNVWVGRLYGGVFSIKREDWREGLISKRFDAIFKDYSMTGKYPPQLLWYDTFNRADGAIGSPVVGAALTMDTGTFTIAANRIASGSAGNNRGLVDVGSADHAAETVVSAGAAGASWLIVRALSANDFYRIGINGPTPNGLTVQQIVGGGLGAISKLVESPFDTNTLAAGFKLRVVCKGRKIKIYVNDVFWEEITDTLYFSTGVKAGLAATNAGVAFDYLTVVST